MPGKAPRRAWTRGAVGGLLLLAAACAQILNADGIVIVDESSNPPESGPPPVCQPLQLRCEGAALQICREDQSGFRTARVCSGAALCCAGPSGCASGPGCQPPVCTPGDFRCEGSVLSVCNEELTGWTPIVACASAAQCNASLGRCSDEPCNPSTPDRQCSNGQLLECEPSGWASLGDCATRALCSAGSAATGCAMTGCLDVRGDGEVLVPSPFKCDNGDLLRCNDDQTEFEFVETCLNLFHCSPLRDVIGDPAAGSLALPDLRQLGCTPPACTPGKYVCDGGKLMRCNVTRTGLTEEQDCGSPGRCNATTGSCSAQDCTPGETQCSGPDLQVCTAERTWQTRETCAGAAQCTRAGCQPARCEVTQYRCSGSSLERCNVDGTDWIAIHTCETAALCNAAAKRCDRPLCTTGDLRCSRDGKLQRCAPERNAWDLVSDCRELAQLPETATPEQISAVCDPRGGGRCNAAPSCAADSRRCNGQYLERCRNDTWQPQERCATAALCDASGLGSCRVPSCTPGAHRCVIPGASPIVAEPGDSMLGLTLQVCDAGGGGYVNVRDCAADSYCDARHGQCDLCEAQTALCFGPSLYRCSEDGMERELEKACNSGCAVLPDESGDDRPTCREDAAASSGVAG